MHQHIVIVTGGRIENTEFLKRSVGSLENRLLIACDSGVRHLERALLAPDVVLGDMDSIDPQRLEQYRRKQTRLVMHPPDKDYTDTALALQYALELKPRQIDIWGALGGRFDHALANVLLLITGHNAGVPTCLQDEYCEMRIADNPTRFENATGCLVSLIALSPAVEGVTLQGFAYPLEHETLSMSESRGISNLIVAPLAAIHVRTGNLLVVRYRQSNVFPEVM